MSTHQRVVVGSLERPIKVMRIIARLNIGGPAIHVSLVTAGINGDGFTSTLVTGRVGPNEGDMSYLADRYGVAPVFLDGLGREISVLDDIQAFFNLLRLISRERPDVVHTHTTKAGVLGRFAAWLCRVPVIVHTFHGHGFEGYVGSVQSRLFIILEQVAALMSTVVLTISDGLREDLIHFRIAPPVKIKVVPLGLDLDWLRDLGLLRGKLRGQLGTQPDTPLVGIVGRLVNIKDHKLFLQAARKIVDQDPAVQFVVVGDGVLRVELEELTRQLGLEKCVHFIGWQHELDWIYADLDVLALTSKNEGTPVSIIEALAAQVPVVATAVGGVPDVLNNGEFGRLVEPGSPDVFAEAVLACLRSGKDRQQLAMVQKQVLDRYSSARLVDDLKRLYRLLLAERGMQVKEA